MIKYLSGIFSGIFLPGFLLLSCSTNHQEADTNRVPDDIQEAVNKVSEFAEKSAQLEIFNEENCSQFLDEYSKYYIDKHTSYVTPRNQSDVKFLKDNLESTIKELYQIQTQVHVRFREFKNPTRKCANSLLQAIRVSRVAIDYLVDWGFDNGLYREGFDDGFTGPFPHVIEAPASDSKEIQVGDIFLQRGKTFISATIARIGEADTNVSHLTIVAQDPRTKALYVVEAEPNTGVHAVPLKEWLAKPVQTRLIHLRYKEPKVAAVAGNYVYQWFREAEAKKKNIRYDFKMIPWEYSEIFCSELIQAAFDLTSRGKIKVPEFSTSFAEFEGLKFMKQLGVDSKEVFAPGDIEADRRFQVLREWRQIGKVKDEKSHFNGVSHLTQNRIQDAAVMSIFKWMFELKYEFSPNAGSWLGSKLAKAALAMGIATDLAQKHVTAKFVNSTIRIMSVVEDIEEQLVAYDKQIKASTRFAPTFRDLLFASNEFRKRDCKTFQDWKAAERRVVHSNRPGGNVNTARLPEFHRGYSVPDGSCPN